MYKGGIGQWSWIFHRITGVGVLLFLLIHILDTALIILGPQAYNAVISLYRHPVFKVFEIGLVAAVLFHALNGVRIILFDFWVDLTRFHRQLFTVQMVLFVLIMIPVIVIMGRHVGGP